MSSPKRNGRATTLTLAAEAYVALQILSPGPKAYGDLVSRLLVQELTRQETRREVRKEIAHQLLADDATIPTPVGV